MYDIQTNNMLKALMAQRAQQLGSVMTPDRIRLLENELTGFFLVAGQSLGNWREVGLLQEGMASKRETALLTRGLSGEVVPYRQTGVARPNPQSIIQYLQQGKCYVVPEIGTDADGTIIAHAKPGDEVAVVFYRGDKRAVNNSVAARNLSVSDSEAPAVQIEAESSFGGSPMFAKGANAIHGTGTFVDALPGTYVSVSSAGISFNKVKVVPGSFGNDLHLILKGMGAGYGSRGVAANTSARYFAGAVVSECNMRASNDPSRKYTIDMKIDAMRE